MTRAKNGISSAHPFRGPELWTLRRVLKDCPGSSYVFVTERGVPLTTSVVRKIMSRTGKEAVTPFFIHPHMLRQSARFKIANDGQVTRAIRHYLGHKNIQHAVRCSEPSQQRFRIFRSGLITQTFRKNVENPLEQAYQQLYYAIVPLTIES